MHIFYEISKLRSFLDLARREGRSIGLVPTMGALHAGHLTLVDRSVTENDLTVCSIFVNPIQFNNPEDLQKYPRTLSTDCEMLEAAGCDVVFAPSTEEMYPEAPQLTMSLGSVETVMEGVFRPGHFNGVGIVVAKLFNIVQPAKAYFGQKDLQQTAVVKTMIRDLSMPVSVVVCATMREQDGLAMSSRNQRLSQTERALSPHIFRCLTMARDRLITGESVGSVKELVKVYFDSLPAFRIEYFEMAAVDTLEPRSVLGPAGQNALCFAGYLGTVRLIDNIIF